VADVAETNLVSSARHETLPRDLLEAHWRAAWDAMEAAGHDALLVCGRGIIGQYGNLLYLTGLPLVLAHGYVFLRRGEPAQLVLGKREQITAGVYGVDDLVWRTALQDIKYGLGPSTGLAEPLSAFIDVHGLREARIGIVGERDVMPTVELEALRAMQVRVEFVRADDLMQKLKAVKSEIELRLYEDAAALVDRGFETFIDQIGLGSTEAELAAGVEQTVRREGALPHTIIQVLSDQMYTRPPTLRRLGGDELVCCWVELVSPKGFWVEKGAMFRVGEPCDRWMEVYAGSEQAFNAAEDLLVPGRTAAEVAGAVEEIAREIDCRVGIQVGHGVGIDHDIPVLSADDKTVFAPGMLISLHPHLHDARYGAMSIEQYTITSGSPVRHSKVPRQLFEVAQ
jgi:Xaa-Pro aminopeptidase